MTIEYTEFEGLYYKPETRIDVKRVLSRLYRSQQRVRMFYGDVATGKAWSEENDVLGRVGRSTGRVKVPLLVYNARSMGGGAILDHCIVGIKTKGAWLYKHEALDLGQWTVAPITQGELTALGYTFEAVCDGETQARFKSVHSARAYVQFMLGERFCK